MQKAALELGLQRYRSGHQAGGPGAPPGRGDSWGEAASAGRGSECGKRRESRAAADGCGVHLGRA